MEIPLWGMPNYPKEQLWELYENLPKELQEAVFSAENADKISDICARNGADKENVIPEIAKYTGYVLLGVLPPDELNQTLKTELQLDEKTAKQVSWEISRFVFMPVKNSLELLYKMEIAPDIKPEEGMAVFPSSERKNNKEKIKKTRKEDKYREGI